MDELKKEIFHKAHYFMARRDYYQKKAEAEFDKPDAEFSERQYDKYTSRCKEFNQMFRGVYTVIVNMDLQGEFWKYVSEN